MGTNGLRFSGVWKISGALTMAAGKRGVHSKLTFIQWRLRDLGEECCPPIDLSDVRSRSPANAAALPSRCSDFEIRIVSDDVRRDARVSGEYE